MKWKDATHNNWALFFVRTKGKKKKMQTPHQKPGGVGKKELFDYRLSQDSGHDFSSLQALNKRQSRKQSHKKKKGGREKKGGKEKFWTPSREVRSAKRLTVQRRTQTLVPHGQQKKKNKKTKKIPN